MHKMLKTKYQGEKNIGDSLILSDFSFPKCEDSLKLFLLGLSSLFVLQGSDIYVFNYLTSSELPIITIIMSQHFLSISRYQLLFYIIFYSS